MTLSRSEDSKSRFKDIADLFLSVANPKNRHQELQIGQKVPVFGVASFESKSPLHVMVSVTVESADILYCTKRNGWKWLVFYGGSSTMTGWWIQTNNLTRIGGGLVVKIRRIWDEWSRECSPILILEMKFMRKHCHQSLLQNTDPNFWVGVFSCVKLFDKCFVSETLGHP